MSSPDLGQLLRQAIDPLDTNGLDRLREALVDVDSEGRDRIIESTERFEDRSSAYDSTPRAAPVSAGAATLRDTWRQGKGVGAPRWPLGGDKRGPSLVPSSSVTVIRTQSIDERNARELASAEVARLEAENSEHDRVLDELQTQITVLNRQDARPGTMLPKRAIAAATGGLEGLPADLRLKLGGGLGAHIAGRTPVLRGRGGTPRPGTVPPLVMQDALHGDEELPQYDMKVAAAGPEQQGVHVEEPSSAPPLVQFDISSPPTPLESGSWTNLLSPRASDSPVLERMSSAKSVNERLEYELPEALLCSRKCKIDVQRDQSPSGVDPARAALISCFEWRRMYLLTCCSPRNPASFCLLCFLF